MIFAIDDVEVDLDAFEIRRGGDPVRVEPQVFEVIRMLVEQRGRLVSKEDLLDTVWGTRFVTESSLTSRIKDARRVLGDDGRTQRVIQTVHGRGYRFVAPVTELGDRVAVATMAPPVAATGAPPLLEREAALATLAAAVAGAARGRGRVVLVAGEPGIGKTALVRAFLGALDPTVRRLTGACDDLVTPRALGPFDDIALDMPELADALRDPHPGEVQRILLSSLAGPTTATSSASSTSSTSSAPSSASPTVTVLVVEDVHWADEATIDVLTSLVRRVERTPTLVILTYRDGEVVDAHPLLRMLGSVPPGAADHLRLEPLSTAAIATLVGNERAADVAEATAGVPFFVSEVAALHPDSGADLPTTVTHAVLARVTTLPEPTRELLERVAVEPSRTATSVLARLVPDWADVIGPAERAAIVATEPGSVAFRHELARRAVLESMRPSRRRELHRELVAALVAADADPDRIVHHAAAAGDADLLVAHAIPAARRAAAASAHRQAWAHLQRILPLLDHLPIEDVPRLLETASHEAYDAGENDDAHQLADRALAGFETAGDAVAAGRLHRWLSRIHWIANRRDDADRAAQRAVAVLEPLGPSEELAWAYSTLSQLAMLAWNDADAIANGRRAIELAERFGAQAVVAHAMVNMATVAERGTPGDDRGMRRAVDVARATGQHHEVVRGLINFAYDSVEADVLDRADDVAREALAYAEEHEIETLRAYLVILIARIAFLEGRWDDAERGVAEVSGTTSAVNRTASLRILAHLRVRRGDPAAAETVAAHRALVDSADEAERTLPALEIEAERAWFTGQLGPLVPAMRAALPAAATIPAHAGRIARWLQEAGALDEVPDGIPEPHLAELQGRWADAADDWEARGMPYEAALAASHGDGEARARALAIARRLDARPLIDRLEHEGR